MCWGEGGGETCFYSLKMLCVTYEAKTTVMVDGYCQVFSPPQLVKQQKEGNTVNLNSKSLW